MVYLQFYRDLLLLGCSCFLYDFWRNPAGLQRKIFYKRVSSEAFYQDGNSLSVLEPGCHNVQSHRTKMADGDPAEIHFRHHNDKVHHDILVFISLFAVYLSIPLLSAVNKELRLKVFYYIIVSTFIVQCILPTVFELLAMPLIRS